MQELKAFTKSIRSDFWLKGEVIHGDYNSWLGDNMLDSVTNYECYKGLFSSCNDTNLFEIAYSLKRQFAEGGIYQNRLLYNFADNHDVNRVASQLKEDSHLYPLYGLLFTIPGIPSLYYGSEMGLKGEKDKYHDDHLRPALDLETLGKTAPHPELKDAIKRFAWIRRENNCLKHGNYQQVYVNHEQLAFRRSYQDEEVLVIVNTSAKEVPLKIESKNQGPIQYQDLLNGNVYQVKNNQLEIQLMPNWLMILQKV